jgi:putative copper export protein
MAKVFVFMALIILAGANRFFLMPRLPSDGGVLERLARNVALEQACGLVILAAAAVLGILAPPA